MALQYSGSNSGYAAIEADGAILVDGAYTWNSSQVWSDNLSGTTNTAKAFDGNVDTTCDPVEQLAGSITYSSATPIFKSGDTVKIKTYTSNTGNNVTVGGIDGVTTIAEGVDAFTATSDVSSFSLTGPSGGSARIYYISVNGELLVDACFSSNGFYLPFDPAQTGANYSSNAVATGDYFSGDSVSDAFDGNLRTNGFRTTMADSSTATLT